MSRRSAIGSGKVADVKDLLNPDFGQRLRRRYLDGGQSSMPPKKLWEQCWIADRFEEISAGSKPRTVLGLGVGVEAMIFHCAHFAEKVIATDLYDDAGSWAESRTRPSGVYEASPFAYPRDRVDVKNMDMRKLTLPDNSVDGVWSCSSVEHVATLAEFIQIFREVHRVLAPGGHAVITTEFSLDGPYFLPGVLSLWNECALFKGSLKGLTLASAVDLRFDDKAPGNVATVRRDTHRLSHLYDLQGGPTGICVHTGYTRLTPVGFVLHKSGEHFEWPENLGAPGWYAPFSRGLAIFDDRANSAAAAMEFRKALQLAAAPGARLHCYRFWIDALVNARQVPALNQALDQYAAEMHELPDDNDALDLIAYVAANQNRPALAQRIWERAFGCRGAVPLSRLQIRVNQLDVVLRSQGASPEAAHLGTLAEAVRFEAQDFHGAGDPGVTRGAEQLAALRASHGLPLPGAPPGAIAAAAPPRARQVPVSVQNPDFDLANPVARPIAWLGGDVALTKTVYGHKMYVDTRSQVGACFLMDGYWEEWIFRHLKDFVRPGMHAIDIGANMGFYTMALCELVGAEGHVTAFEPWPEYYGLLRRNVEVNGFIGRSTLVQKGVEHESGSKTLRFSRSYGTGSTVESASTFLEARGYAKLSDHADIRTVSLDDYLGQNPHLPDFIKIDVDGAEALVVTGMRTLLESRRPLTIFCEFSPSILRDDRVDPQDMIDKLLGAGFEMSHFTPAGIQPYRYSGQQETSWVELLLVRR